MPTTTKPQMPGASPPPVRKGALWPEAATLPDRLAQLLLKLGPMRLIHLTEWCVYYGWLDADDANNKASVATALARNPKRFQRVGRGLYQLNVNGKAKRGK